MLDMTFTIVYAYALLLIAMILGIRFTGPEKYSAYRRGQNGSF